MGLPAKHRKNFVSHKKRWDKNTIVSEGELVNDYALKNKKEIRKVELLISKYKKIAKELNRTVATKESEQAKHFIESLKAKGILNPEATSLDEVLDITLREVLERRLANIVYKLKFAKTPKQARQFVVHRHVMVGGKVVDSPSYAVTLAEEATVEFTSRSSLFDENHPERKLTLGGVEEEVEKQEERAEVAKVKGKDQGPEFDKKEAQLDDEEADEVQE